MDTEFVYQMATTLEQYYQTKQQLSARITEGTLTQDQLLGYQELLYRISVLESCMNFVKTAPVTADSRQMGFHYHIVDSYFTCLLQEHQLGVAPDEKLKKQRSAALNNLQVVVNCLRKQFQSFAPTHSKAYQEAIAKMVNTILPAWLQYRFTYVPF